MLALLELLRAILGELGRMRQGLDGRMQLGTAAVMSEATAAAALPVRTSTARAWLEARGLVRDVPQLGRVVVWGDVLDEIRLGRGPVEDASPRTTGGGKLPRAVVVPRRR